MKFSQATCENLDQLLFKCSVPTRGQWLLRQVVQDRIATQQHSHQGPLCVMDPVCPTLPWPSFSRGRINCLFSKMKQWQKQEHLYSCLCFINTVVKGTYNLLSEQEGQLTCLQRLSILLSVWVQTKAGSCWISFGKSFTEMVLKVALILCSQLRPLVGLPKLHSKLINTAKT